MTKYNVGDKVRVVKAEPNRSHFGYKNGDKFTVEHTYSQGVIVNGGNRIDLRLHEVEIELISEATTPKYKTEKRKANVGERILITNATISCGNYKNGDVLTVGGYYQDPSRHAVKSTVPSMISINHEEYEVIVAEKPSKNERISLLESQVAELTAKVEALQKPKTTVHNVTVNVPTDVNTSAFAEMLKKRLAELSTHKRPPNKDRKAVIERAKAFVTEHTKRNGVAYDFHGVSFGKNVCTVQFIVNIDKRAVTLLAKGVNSGKLRAKAIAKCAPDDVFNADIGKAIALGRALGLDVSEFENAVKPTEAVIGQRVRYAGGRSIRKVTKEYENYATNSAEFVNRKIVDYDIIDDTEAQY